jgi:hypothetical protein
MASTGGLSKAFGGGRAGLQMGLGKIGRDLKLTDEQQEKAAALYADYQKRQLVLRLWLGFTAVHLLSSSFLGLRRFFSLEFIALKFICVADEFA